MLQPVSKGCDDQSVSTTKEFVLVDKIDISNRYNTLISVILEVEPRLLQPFEVRHRFDMKFDKFVKYITLVNMDGDEGFKFRPLELGQISCGDID